MEGAENTHGCKKQKAKDENGVPIYKAVELYAKKANAKLWMKDFVNAFDKMQQNGYDKNDLTVSKSNPWSHRCCIQTGININGVGFKSLDEKRYNATGGNGDEEAKSPLACQKYCQSQPECGSFLYRTQNGNEKAACKLRAKSDVYDYLKKDDGNPADYFQKNTQKAHNFMVGPKKCRGKDKDCDMFDNVFNVAA